MRFPTVMHAIYVWCIGHNGCARRRQCYTTQICQDEGYRWRAGNSNGFIYSTLKATYANIFFAVLIWSFGQRVKVHCFSAKTPEVQRTDDTSTARNSAANFSTQDTLISRQKEALLSLAFTRSGGPTVVPNDREALAAAADAARHTQGCYEEETPDMGSSEDFSGTWLDSGSTCHPEVGGVQCRDSSFVAGASSYRARGSQYHPAFYTVTKLFAEESGSPELQSDIGSSADRSYRAAKESQQGACSVWGGTYVDRKKAFLQRYAREYHSDIEFLQSTELHRFAGQIYLDYAGSGVYQETQLRQAYLDLTRNAYGNSHSRNPSAKLTEERLSEARMTIKRFFDAPSDQYNVIFTSGATAALKLLGESFSFSSNLSSFFYLRINHSSVLGIREFAYAKNVKSVRAVSAQEVEQILRRRQQLYTAGQQADDTLPSNKPYCLFAFPAKDNWNGTFFPLSWIERVQKFGLSNDTCRWFVLLDAAAYASTSPLSLSQHPADFVVVSFYKLFGYPSGLGALVARSDDAAALQRVYWGGGSVAASVCDSRWCKRKDDFSLKFEDGTVSFLAIAASIYGFKALQEIGMETISLHVASLTEHLYERLLLLIHSNGAPGVLLYWNDPDPPSGGIVNFNVLRPDGSFVPYSEVEAAAAIARVHLRTGCFCNPGGCQDFLGLVAEEIIASSESRNSCSDPTSTFTSFSPTDAVLMQFLVGKQPSLQRKPLGSVRVSLGYMSTFEDVDTFVSFLSKKFLK